MLTCNKLTRSCAKGSSTLINEWPMVNNRVSRTDHRSRARRTINLLLTHLLGVMSNLIVISLIVCCLPLLSTATNLISSVPLSLSSSSSSSLPIASSSSSSDTFYFEIAENTGPGQLVGQVPTKPGFTYRFNVDTPEFRFDQSTGSILTTSVPTDRETRDFYQLVLLSSSPTYPIEIRIRVTDVNDNPPYWPPYINRNISFSESAPIGTKLILETAIDPDEGNLTYEIVQTTVTLPTTSTTATSTTRRSTTPLTDATTTSPSIQSDSSVNASSLSSVDGSFNEPPFKLSYNVSSSFLHLEVSDSLDRETQSHYIVNISAVDEGGLSAFLTLHVTILDVNDNPPIFDHSDYTVSLNETVGKGVPILQVRATDADEEGNDNTAISYYLLVEKYFTIDTETGVIYTAQEGPIDCGTTPSSSSFSSPSPTTSTHLGTSSTGYKVCVFTVFAHDHGTPRQNGRAYITINLLDTNDHDPVIKFRHLSRSEVATVDENAVNGSVVTAISVSDADHGPNGETSLIINSGNEVGHFRLESIGTSHIIRVNGLLDREKMSLYNLTIIARDYGSPARSSTANLVIIVNDVNDHEPVFNRDVYEVNIVESLPIGSFVASIGAVDMDEGINAKLYYSLSGPNAHFFHIDTLTGLVTTEKIINREETPVFELKATARDGGPNPKWAYSTLKINMLDVNDEVPNLILPKDSVYYDNQSSSFIYEIEESNKLNIPLITVDRDLGANGTVDCNLLYKFGGLFQIIDSSTGTGSQHALISTRELDYEKCSSYRLTIIVKDRGLPGHQLSSSLTLTILVKDKDDHRPIVYPSTYFAFIPVDFSSLNYSVVVSRVLIRDRDILSPVTFGLESGSQSSLISSILSLNSRTGEINLKTGGSTRSNVYSPPSTNLPSLLRFNVTCKNCEPGKARASFNVYTLTDENRKSVESLKRSYEFEILESAGIGAIVGKIDLDAGKFDLTIVSGDVHGVFTVDRHYLKVAGQLDRETQSVYKLQLVAFNEKAFLHIDVQLSLIDVNDNQPLFTEQFIELVLPVDVPPKLTIYRLNAIDADQSTSSSKIVQPSRSSSTSSVNASSNSLDIRYDLISNPDHLLFIKGNELKVNRSLSSLYPPGRRYRSHNDALDFITFEVMATDPGVTTPFENGHDTFSQSSCGITNRLTIYLIVKAVNTARPRFNSMFYEISVSESITVNSQFLNIAATDDDGDSIGYRITSGNLGESFGIFPNGQLYVKRPLDRETVETYSLTIVAYEIQPDSVAATDGPTNELRTYYESRSTTQAIIHCIDENDNPPMFTNKTFHFRLEENCQENSPIGQLQAWDSDKGANSEIRYSLSESNATGLVEIDPYSGHLWSKVTFDAETTPYLTLEVYAIDQSFESQRLTSTATVIVEIIDINDNPPLFITPSTTTSENDLTNDVAAEGSSSASSSSNSVPSTRTTIYPVESFSLSEDTPIGTRVATIEATDADLSSAVVYKQLDSTVRDSSRINNEAHGNHEKIVGGGVSEDGTLPIDSNGNGNPNTNGDGSNYFTLNSTTGVITLSRPIDREVTSLIELLVSADDGLHTSYKLLRFVIEDVNDNPPRFINFPTSPLTLAEDVKVGSIVLTLTAVDPDLSDNGSPIRYELTQSSTLERKRKLFDISESSVIVISQLDFESENRHYLNICAVDGAGHRSDIQMLTIMVTDVNDCSPTFNLNHLSPLSPSTSGPSQSDIVKVLENIEIGSKLVNLAAYDCDVGDSLFYEIISCETRKGDSAYLSSSYLPDGSITRGAGRYRKLSEQLETAACPVTINPTNGDLVSSNSLDREVAETISVGIRVRDKVGHSVIKQVTLLLEDINDNYPEFVSPDLFLITSANANINGNNHPQHHFNKIEENQIIGTVKAIDVDAGINSVITYKLASTSSPSASSSADHHQLTSDYLVIDPRTGVIRTRRSLEGYVNRPINVLAIDGAGLVTSDTVTFIHLPQPNLYSKSHEKSDLTLEVYENEPVGLRLHKFKCSSDRLEKCEYFVRRAFDRTIAIDRHSGDLYIQSNLDREMVDSYSIEVVSIQGYEVYSTMVNIKVLDKDDNPPSFKSSGSSLLISEATPPASELFDLSTITRDPDVSSKIEYKLINCTRCYEPTFRVDTFSGKIILQKPLDRETIDSYTLIVGASDSFHLTTKKIQITVTDVNDNAPHFRSKQYYFDIPENTDRGTVIGSIEAFDLDLAPHTLTYAMVSDGSFGGPEPEEYIFNLNEKTGKFTLMRHLDYESDPNHFIITCEAFDGLYRSEQINVYFNLINLNDNWPIFDPAMYKVELLENVTLGHSVACLSATDADTFDSVNGIDGPFNGSSSSINFYFKDTSSHFGMVTNGDSTSSSPQSVWSSTNELAKLVSGPFKIDSTSGCIELISLLDRESVTHYDLTVIADDGFHRTSATVSIKVKDVNDNEPIFDPRTPTILRVPENLGPDSLVYGFKADDADEVPNNYVRYDLENGDPTSGGDFPFIIGPINGLLRLTGRLDRETIGTYSLIVRARDYGGKSSSIRVTVHVSDVNDNSPSFEQSELHVSIPENASLQSTVITLRAYDQDSPDKISYRIASGDVYGHFGINEDTVIVTMALDYETIPTYDLRVQAIDEAGNSDTARLVINLINVHDQPPNFVASPYSVNWCENEIGFIGTFQAIGETITDKSSSSNQPELNYLLKNNHEGYFELNSTTAQLTAIKPIDRESLMMKGVSHNGANNTNGFIELRIIAIDKRLPRLTGEGIVLINIIDVNDNRPMFESPNYSFELIENTIHSAGKPFASVKATDLDSIDSLVYKIIDSDSDLDAQLFVINSSTGELSLRSDMTFNRESRSSYHLTIQVSDSKWTDKTKVTITIGDVNDCKPMFRSINGQSIDLSVSSIDNQVNLKYPPSRLSLLHDDLFLFGLYVTDCDLPGSANSRVQFNIETISDLSSSPPQSGSDGLFTIDERTGVVRSTRSLESNSNYTIKVIAEDMSLRNRLENQLIVDLNIDPTASTLKQKRLIELVHKISVSESVKVGKIVHSFGLLPDIPSSSIDSIVLKIIGGDAAGHFRVDRKYLRIAKPLDYEESTSYELYIEATLYDTYEISRVTIEVTNENDNAPTFDHDQYNATIVEEIEEPVLVASLGATDRDLVADEDGEGLEGKLRYFIESPLKVGSDSLPFRVDEKYGTLWTTRKIDRESTPTFDLVMGVRDEDGLTGRTRVTITVLDKNDNPPRFTRLFNVNITENAHLGSVVIQVTSSDRDEGSYAQATYSLLGHSEAFDIKPTTGEVFVTGHLDREVKDEYLLSVSVNDGSWKAQTTLTINIIDENDNEPIFDKPLYEFNYIIPNEQTKSTVNQPTDLIGQVHARDLDKGYNSMISYSFKHNSDYFTIDSVTGLIKVKSQSTINGGDKRSHKLLKYNTQLSFLNHYNLTVIASDRGVIPQSSETNVLITLQPSSSSSSTTISSSTPSGLSIGGSSKKPSTSSVHKIAIPYDLTNGTLLYHLDLVDYVIKDSSPSNKIITLTPSGDVIFIGQGVIKRREEWTYKFEPSTPSTTSQQSNLITFIVTICSPNRSPPRFTSGQSQLVVPENELTNDILTQFKATDDDEDAVNSQITYSFEIIEWTFNERAGDYYRRVIKPSLEPSENLLIGLSLKTLLNQTVSTKSILRPFTLDPSTGIVYLNALLDYELITSYRLRVTATDSAYFGSRDTSILVNIHVTDVNDNAPLFVGLRDDGRLLMETLENNAIGSTVGIIAATDYDSLRYSQLTYEILPEQDSGYFSLGPKNGHLSSLVSFDYETKRTYSIKVIARNDRKIFTTVPVEIRIGNVNEYLPKFKSSRFTFDLTKSMTAGSVIGSLADKATDEDYNETIYFYFINHRRFGIELNRNGTLRLTESIDFNNSYPSNGKGLTFTVIAKNVGPIRDRSDYDEAKIVINIVGANRLSHFNQSNYICNGDKSICSDTNSTSPDALSVGTILFVIFFVIILLVLLASFVIFRQQRKRPMPSCIGGAIGQRKLMGLRQIPMNKSHHTHTLNSAHSQSSSFLHHPAHHNQPSAPPAPPPPPPPPMTKQRPPDVIESPISVPPAPPIPQRAPPVPPPSFMTPFSDITEDYSDIMLTGEQYDLENASSIAPSDIDLVYRYKGFRSAGLMNGQNSISNGTGQHHRHAPLARLSPSVSELTAPRILTLNDLTSTNGTSSVIPLCPPRPHPPPKSKLGPPCVISNRHQYNPMTGSNQNHNHLNHVVDDEDGATSDSFSSSEFDGSSNYERAENNKNMMLRRVL